MKYQELKKVDEHATKQCQNCETIRQDVADLTERRDMLRDALVEMSTVFGDVIDQGDVTHDDKNRDDDDMCPEDENCVCTNIAKINAAFTRAQEALRAQRHDSLPALARAAVIEIEGLRLTDTHKLSALSALARAVGLAGRVSL